VYLILLLVFLILLLVFFVWGRGSSTIWGKYYSKEISRVINLANPGDKITLDVQKATEIAKDNEIAKEEIFSFDNVNDKVCVKLSPGKKTCYSYFNDVDIVNYKIEIGVPNNVLTFEISEAAK
jgi:hypothetical protein